MIDNIFRESSAEISPCGRYRYNLRRIWDRRKRPVLFVMLNPSRADASVDDPTIRRCIGFASAWGRGGIIVENLFAFRATKPTDLLLAEDPVGPDNLHIGVGDVALIIAAWGSFAAKGMTRERANFVLKSFAERGLAVHCLGETKDGCPKHPLYLAKNTKPRLYNNPWSK